MRVVVFGGPGTGKTTLTATPRFLARFELRAEQVQHTDELVGVLEWSEASRVVAAEWMAEPDPWAIEGVAVPRALRKWLAANPEGRPCEVAIYLARAWRELTPGQATMTKGLVKVWDEVRPEMMRRGVVIETGDVRGCFGGDGP